MIRTNFLTALLATEDVCGVCLCVCGCVFPDVCAYSMSRQSRSPSFHQLNTIPKVEVGDRDV